MTRAASSPSHAAGAETDPALAASYAACRRVTQQQARNFYYGLRLTPEPRRSALYAVYAWTRRADDCVDADAPAAERRAALDAFRARTADALAGTLRNAAEPHPEPWWPAFADAARRHALPRAFLFDLLDGMESDLEPVPLRTTDDLELYCYRVASTVGMLCTRIWGLAPGASEDEAMRLARVRGRAFQLTNILRDLGEDLDASPPRVYLPEDSLRSHAVDPAALRAWSPSDACAALVRTWAAEARRSFTESAPLDAMIASDCRPVLGAMTRIYAEILALIEADPARAVSGRRAALPAVRKLRIALSAALARTKP